MRTHACIHTVTHSPTTSHITIRGTEQQRLDALQNTRAITDPLGAHIDLSTITETSIGTAWNPIPPTTQPKIATQRAQGLRKP
ncbi:MAG: hypothetical protein HC945_00985 [Nitrosarchaeum sp.]|nr:hypothetical protein [Nitrosarchaeum sp.]